jgi:rRNA maturation RNase YbeY
MAITFQHTKSTAPPEQKALIKKWIGSVIQKEGRVAGDLNFLLTSDEEVLEMNKRYLNHDTLTDIITFDYCENNLVSGDIVISVERVRENAVKFEVPHQEELRRVMIHGVLHLCGYKDKKKSDKDLMRRKENAALKLFRIQFSRA